ncbi:MULTISPECIES: hypothetical protein [Veillonella]|uniref:hypothetical protein n=1 Tax=Veillonella TaxID=29465 RepID=UPI001D08962B|nr:MULTISPECIES: hypothetical protein [Veillonella]MBS6122384.1 hypothetical protein [Veillonella sp.]MCB6515811.1 hypothetical protein [Veillonella atypica]MCG4863521.1 hypothetical protein [Veillonella atypica]MDU6632585.1 hypothetical protein [Veillonella sp.]
MERVSASLIEEIRSALVERYNRDQEIQQMIEEIGAEEGLNEKELFVIHQAYLEVKERMQYTANLMELWNQIEAVQDHMSMLNSYESLERDLFGDVLSFDKPMGYGASNQDNLDYAMEQIKLQDIDTELENIEMAKDYLINKKDSNSNMKDIDLAKEYPIDDQDIVYFNEHSANKKTTSNRDDVNEDNFDDEEDDSDNESLLDRDIRTSLDPYDMVNSLLYSKQSTGDKDKTKQQKEIDKLIKKQLKRVEEEWAKLSGKKDKKDKKKKDKDKKKDKKDKQSKKEFELVKESKKSKKDKESKKSKKDKDSKKAKKDKDAKKDKKAKKLEKALKKEFKKSTKKD